MSQVISGSISFIIHAVSGESLVSRGNPSHALLKLNMKKQGSHLTMHLILNLSLSGIKTEAGRFILFQFKVIVTSFQSNSITHHSIFLFNLICS